MLRGKRFVKLVAEHTAHPHHPGLSIVVGDTKTLDEIMGFNTTNVLSDDVGFSTTSNRFTYPSSQGSGEGEPSLWTRDGACILKATDYNINVWAYDNNLGDAGCDVLLVRLMDRLSFMGCELKSSSSCASEGFAHSEYTFTF